MVEITTNATLKLNSLFSYRGMIKKDDIEMLACELREKIHSLGAIEVGEPIVATYFTDEDSAEVEMLFPIDKQISSGPNMQYKEKIEIVNAVKLSYKGNFTGLDNACEKLNDYISENKLQPITASYSISKTYDKIADKVETEIYIGINPNKI